MPVPLWTLQSNGEIQQFIMQCIYAVTEIALLLLLENILLMGFILLKKH